MSRGPIFCMGGGGFTMEPGRPALDRYVLSQAAAARPRVLFLPTASGDPQDQITRFQRVFGGWPCRPRILSLFHRADLTESLSSLVLGQDVIYVGGGSMVNLLALWRAHGLPELLDEANRRGTVLAGLSAGAMCWMDGGVSQSTGKPTAQDGLGFVRGSLSVHARQDPARGEALRSAIASGRLPGGWTVDDHAGVLFLDGTLEECVASRPDAAVHRVERDAEGTRTTPVAVRRLEEAADARRLDAAFERSDARNPRALDARDELRYVNRLRHRATADRDRRRPG